MEAKKIAIESSKPVKGKKNETNSSDVSLKRKNIKETKAKSSNNSKTSQSKLFAIYEKRKMIEPLRKELLMRGWTEKLIADTMEMPKFVWLARSNSAVVTEGSSIVNRLKQKPLKNFCYKDILINYGRELKSENNKARKLNMPRTFKLFAGETNEFIDDYRLTAYSSFIRFLHSTGSTVFSETGRISSKWIEFAIEKLEAAMVSNTSQKSETNSDSTLAKEEKRGNKFSKFKKIYQSVVKYNSKIKANAAAGKNLLQQCKVIYGKCKEAWKDFDRDGFYNLWLLKPARRSLGIGIKLFDDDIDILSYARDNDGMKYLVQKYVGEF